MKKHIICVGNPGTGKSTLLNSMLEVSDPEKKYDRFKSGVSIAKGLTYELNTVSAADIVYMDTPGLADVRLRKQAAKAIHDALKRGGVFQVIMVVTLESGRVRSDDAATVKLILESAPDIKEFGVIFNKVTKGVIRALDNDPNRMFELVVEVQPEQHANVVSYPLFLKRRDELEDEDDVCIKIDDLHVFLEALPCITIVPKHVKEIRENKFDEIKEMMENQLQMLREDKEMMRKEMEKMRKKIIDTLANQPKVGILSNLLMKIGL